VNDFSQVIPDFQALQAKFVQMAAAGLDMPDQFCAMFMLAKLPPSFGNLVSTILRTLKLADFTPYNVVPQINNEVWLHLKPFSLDQSLSLRILSSSVKHSFNRTNMIHCGPPQQDCSWNNQWAYQPASAGPSHQGQQRPSSGPCPPQFSLQPQSQCPSDSSGDQSNHQKTIAYQQRQQ
jgi:hypothetical protein